jgi:hypothetical protein
MRSILCLHGSQPVGGRQTERERTPEHRNTSPTRTSFSCADPPPEPLNKSVVGVVLAWIVGNVCRHIPAESTVADGDSAAPRKVVVTVSPESPKPQDDGGVATLQHHAVAQRVGEVERRRNQRMMRQ